MTERLTLAVIVCALNEERYLPTLLASIASQTRLPDRLLLVDDGSSDRTPEIAEQFAKGHSYAVALQRPRRPPEHDRLITAAELRAFLWAVEQLDVRTDVVAKLDADLKLTPQTFATAVQALEQEPALGIAGVYLSLAGPKGPFRERCSAEHVRGAVSFYRRSCLDQISPLPPIIGWDSIDEMRARRHGWRTASFAVPGGDPLHLRTTGAYNGELRGFRRRGQAARAYGAHPLHVLLGGASRLRDRPLVLGGVLYVAGWAEAGLRRTPRAEPELRRFVRREQMTVLRRRAARVLRWRPR